MKQKFTCILYFILLTFFSAILGSQAQTAGEKFLIRGKVIDRQDKGGIPGVSVYEIDADRRTIAGVTTDLEGNYALRVSNPQNRIVFSFIGFKTITEPINNRSQINISLATEGSELTEVVIQAKRPVDNGLINVEKRNMTSAVSSIDARELEEVQATSIDQALQGRMAGVDIVANSGDPGAGMSIRIRGTSSINQSSDPLIVVDGMPYDISVPEDFNFSTADEQGYAQLLSIAPSDIKDITVLKDAASTAMWGSRASNGVLVINTKRGTKGKPTLNYTFKGVGMKQPDAIPMLSGDQYSVLIPEAFMNRTGVPLNTQTVKEFLYDPSDPYYYYNYSNNTDWIDQITRIGSQQDHNISLQGGGDKATYFASLGYNNTKGTTVGTDLDRINARINLNYTVSDRIRFRTDLAYTHTTNNLNYIPVKDVPIRNIAYIKMPNMGPFEYDELGNLSPNYFSPLRNVQGSYPGTYNPLAMALEGKSLATSDRIRPTFTLNYDIFKNKLLTTFDVAFDINNNKTNLFLPQTATGLPIADDDVNRAKDTDTDIFNVDTKTNLIYTPTLGENQTLSVVASFQTNDYRSVNYEATTANSASSLFQDPSVAARIQDASLGIKSGTGQNRRIGLLVNAQYSLLDRYIFNVGVRRDGNSKFSENNRYGNFPAIGARWRISGEPFMQRFSNFLTDLSLRYSYGASGNPPKGSYAHFAQYGNFDYNYLGVSGIYPLDMELKNLKWETVIQSNFGANLSLYDGRVEIDAEIYQKRTKDMFYPELQISSVSGFNNVDMNVGIMDNNGWEITLNTTPYRTQDLTFRFDFNMARNINVIREISEFYPRARGNINANGQYKIFIQENNPFGSFYGFRYKGVYKDAESTVAQDASGNAILDPNGNPIQMRFNYPSIDYLFQPGDAIYEDINNDGNIDYKDVVYLGNANPRLTGGFGPRVTWRNFQFNAFFNFRYGYDIINATKISTESMSNYNNQSTAVLRRWRRIGDETDIPRAVIGPNYNSLGSDRFVEDGSFLRLKYVTVRYNFPKIISQRFKLADLSVYSTVENLLTFTNYTGQDPEVSYRGSDPFRVGYDNSMAPPVKTVTVGLNVRF